MEIQTLFTAFCSVQHRLTVSPQAAALFFYLLGELSASNTSTRSVAIANSRICGTIHTSPAALRKCRDLLIAADIIGFSSADGGRTPALYSVNDPEEWRLDVIPIPPAARNSQRESQVCTPPKDTSDQAVASKPQEPVISEPEVTASSEPEEITASKPEVTVASRSLTLPEPTKSLPIENQKLRSAADTLRRHAKKPIKLSFRGNRKSTAPQFMTHKGAMYGRSVRNPVAS